MPGLGIIGIVAMLAGSAVLVMGAAEYRRTQSELKRHIGLVAPPAPSKPIGQFSNSSVETNLNVALRQIFAVGKRYRWGMQSGVAILLPVAIGSAAIAWILTYRMLGNSIDLATPVSAVAFFMIPRWVLLRQQKVAERQFMELFPSGIDMMVRMLRAGLPISSAVRSIQLETPPPLNMVFGSIADQVTLGAPFEKALDIASDRIGLPDFRFFAVALNLQHATGGNLAATLEILSDLLRKRRAVRLKAAAATAEVRVSAYVLGAIPFVTIGALLYMVPGYIAPLFHDKRGQVILAAAVVLLLLAFMAMRGMIRRVTAAA